MLTSRNFIEACHGHHQDFDCITSTLFLYTAISQVKTHHQSKEKVFLSDCRTVQNGLCDMWMRIYNQTQINWRCSCRCTLYAHAFSLCKTNNMCLCFSWNYYFSHLYHTGPHYTNLPAFVFSKNRHVPRTIPHVRIRYTNNLCAYPTPHYTRPVSCIVYPSIMPIIYSPWHASL